MKDTIALLPHIRLNFNIKHPIFEECYADGYVCAKSDLGESENPFTEGSVEAEHWSEGWWAGFYGEEPLFDLTSLPVEESVLSGNKTTANQTIQATNDEVFHSQKVNLFLLRFLEISSAIAVSAIVGYQIVEMVA